MTIKIEATHHDLVKIKELAKSVDLALSDLGGPSSSWRDVMYEVQEMLTEAEIREAEPLVKDEKTREAIKAWAKANKTAKVFVTVAKDPEGGYLYWELANIAWEQSITICFGGELPDTLEDVKTYTIEELCGEEER